MVSNEDIYFDNKSGISIEEQKEILAQINGIAEKNKKSLLDAATELHNKENIAKGAKKKAAFFPLAVNIAALFILAAGALLLIMHNNSKDYEIRRGTGTYFMAGQAVIGELTAAQQEALQILEDLSREQERSLVLDAYLSGGIANITELVAANQFDEAALAAAELRVFLETPSFAFNRPFMARKEFYAKSIDSVYKLIDDLRKTGGNYITELERKNSELEASVAEMRRSLDALSEGSGGQARRIVQLEDTIAEKDSTIAALETERNNLATERNNLSQNVSELQARNNEQAALITQLNEQLATIRQALQALSQ